MRALDVYVVYASAAAIANALAGVSALAVASVGAS